jgi:TolB-like protein/AraC-like DNA-binding protein
MNAAASMDQIIIQKLTEVIHANLENENFGVSELAIEAGMSRSAVHRKLRTCLKKSASEYIREVRLQKAMEMLQQDVATANEISYKVGFKSPTYFNTCFHQYFGFPPGEVKKRISIEHDQTNYTISTEPEVEKQKASLKSKSFHWVEFHRWTFVIALAIVLGLCALTYFSYIPFIKKATIVNITILKVRDKSIAVLPVRNLSDNLEDQYFADKVMEDILHCLFKIDELKVISQNTVENVSNMTSQEIARKLGVNFILEGSVQMLEEKLRFNMQVIDASYNKPIWSENYDRELADILNIQSNIAKQIADELQTVLLVK